LLVLAAARTIDVQQPNMDLLDGVRVTGQRKPNTPGYVFMQGVGEHEASDENRQAHDEAPAVAADGNRLTFGAKMKIRMFVTESSNNPDN